MRNARRTRRHRPLGVESLESVTLLSGLAPAVAPPAHHVAADLIPTPVIVSLDGTTRGVYRSSNFPDVGTTYSLSTAGRFARYGPGIVSGTLHSVGFIATGHATGTLHVALRGGTLTLDLTGPPQDGFSPLPHTFSYTVTKGSGKFHNAVGDPVGQGTVSVTLTPAPVTVGRRGLGRIALTFTSTPVAIA